MKKLLLSTAVILSSLAYAGGDYIPAPEPVTPIAPSTPQIKISNFYGGLGLAGLSTYGNNSSLNWFSKKKGQDKLLAFVGILGYQFNPNLAIEGRASLGLVNPHFTENAVNLSLFVKPSYNITKEAAIYGLLGFGWVKIDGHHKHPNFIKKASPQFGLGASYKIRENMDVFADYTWLLHKKKAKALLPGGSDKLSHEAITVGVNYHF